MPGKTSEKLLKTVSSQQVRIQNPDMFRERIMYICIYIYIYVSDKKHKTISEIFQTQNQTNIGMSEKYQKLIQKSHISGFLHFRLVGFHYNRHHGMCKYNEHDITWDIVGSYGE